MNDKPRTPEGHQAEAEPAGMGLFNVVCPFGCQLGTSAQSVDQDAARRSVELHALATKDLTVPGYRTPQERINDVWARIKPDFEVHGTITGRIPGPGSLKVQTALEGYRKMDDAVRDALGE